jgi:uncharacterized membrane protein YoaK (UPF0700 family)
LRYTEAVDERPDKEKNHTQTNGTCLMHLDLFAGAQPELNPEGSVAPDGLTRGNSGLFLLACLFATVGGYLDAYSYLAHGHVFANAQTGNVIFFSVYASGGEWAKAARHLPPIIAFAFGVAVAKLLGVRSLKDSLRATMVCQAFEVAILATLAVTGTHLPDAGVVPFISFVAALQNTSFDRIGAWEFNSAMTTGNLRVATAGLILWIVGRETIENRSKAIALGLICLSFLVGALCGGAYTRLDPEYALVPCVTVVAAGFMLTWRERRRALSAVNASPGDRKR